MPGLASLMMRLPIHLPLPAILGAPLKPGVRCYMQRASLTRCAAPRSKGRHCTSLRRGRR